MRHVYGNAFAVTNEMQGQYRHGRDIIVPPHKWAGVARTWWPIKTAAHIGVMAGIDERMAKRWLAGEFPPSASLMMQLYAEMLKREGQ